MVIGEPVDLAHLHPSAHRVAMLPAAERVRHVRADRWIGYTRATDALGQLEQLLAMPSKQRMPNLLLIGPTNNGKSMIIEKFRRDHPPISHTDREEIPVLAVQMPSEPSVLRFYVALLSALGAPVRPRARRLADLEELVLRLCRACGVRMLVIDELHNVLGGRSNVQREFLNLLRFLGNSLRIPLVGVGIVTPTWRSAPTTSSRTGSPHWRCRAGNPGTKRARCWPASRPRSRCGAPRRSRARRWRAIC
ncbi:TniB family NTP-binding protein [Nocardia sp. NBC_01730]|uniref:TniB family NTP-binding protein n=1 Tax=Nocardia sp. NBC_01730 TaxID=2975998 RepID=UPI002E15294C|nr:TniB family NTP-binding protein [Nocardia sp. NBC_01730]